ncbi:DUF3592 domain-containing protein [Streptomyces pseudovenezuelae]|uniref:DUF3592 domain-containing protein n=1 Tax=Streptomyces pseudovenezuelae TaxID=67350 RepID=A0ABT6LXC6_9ACTN|nr:DUF3592 domain-containing protein [Streptomyces pseudovenezuelae]MDH6220444.1 hypothetical protein [Streptomyces pseudovenezuelae]
MADGTLGIAVCAAVGLLLFTVAVRDAVLIRRLRRHGIRTRGVVVDNVRVDGRDSGPTWAPVIAFADQRGYRVEFTSRMRGSGMGLATGREVPVVYLAHNPQTARVGIWRHMVGPVVFVSCASVVFLGAGVLIALTK